MRSPKVLGFRATIVALLGVLVTLAGAPAWSSAASVTSAATVPTGNDISWPQCGSSFPHGQAFGIVGINDGVPGTTNPCLAPSPTSPTDASSELYWAVSTSSGATTQPKASLYVNTSDPGDVFDKSLVTDWPTSGSTPYGTCTTTTVTTSTGPEKAGENSTACAWEYGDKEAGQDGSVLRAAAAAVNAESPPRGVPATPNGYPWWLDVETTNTWQQGSSGQAMNLAALQGFVVGLHAVGTSNVGVYSTSYQWGVITGGTSSTTTSLGGLATWIPGASNVAGAQSVCEGGSFTGGAVKLAQFPNGSFDGDLACGTTVTQPTAVRISGQTADATAAAEFTRAFPYTKGSCPPSHAAVIATTQEYQDALSSQFLAQELTTGTLLTPTMSLAQTTATTLREEGITTVYIVGGPLAVSPTVQDAIGALSAYECGGTTKASPTGAIVVHRISGETQYGTAMAVAEFVGTAGDKSFTGAYATTDATGGTGRYNDTSGQGTAAPAAGSMPTAILASGEEFQDAQSASVISYHTKIPMLLTPATTLSATAVAAIQHLGIKQVILMGGPLAVTDTVEADLAGKTGVSVLRVAGKDYTDTARELADLEAAGSTDGLGWTPGHRVMVARGDGFTDGLAGAVLENSHNGTTGAVGTARPLLLLEHPTTVGSYVTTFLKVTGHGGIDGVPTKAITSLSVLGGTLAVSSASVTSMETDLTH